MSRKLLSATDRAVRMPGFSLTYFGISSILLTVLLALSPGLGQVAAASADATSPPVSVAMLAELRTQVEQAQGLGEEQRNQALS